MDIYLLNFYHDIFLYIRHGRHWISWSLGIEIAAIFWLWRDKYSVDIYGSTYFALRAWYNFFIIISLLNITIFSYYRLSYLSEQYVFALFIDFKFCFYLYFIALYQSLDFMSPSSAFDSQASILLGIIFIFITSISSTSFIHFPLQVTCISLILEYFQISSALFSPVILIFCQGIVPVAFTWYIFLNGLLNFGNMNIRARACSPLTKWNDIALLPLRLMASHFMQFYGMLNMLHLLAHFSTLISKVLYLQHWLIVSHAKSHFSFYIQLIFHDFIFVDISQRWHAFHSVYILNKSMTSIIALFLYFSFYQMSQ